ncbi:unnamed protein product [Effrenium voratum]|nr:unnamed protein product [Effrenium voratum]
MNRKDLEEDDVKAFIFGRMSFATKEQITESMNRVAERDQETATEEEPFDLASGNLFKPFSGKPMKLGDVDAIAGEVEEETHPEEGEAPLTSVALNKKNQHTVGSVRVVFKGISYIYHYPRTATFKKLCEVLLQKYGLNVGCIGFDGHYDFSSILTSYETIGSFFDGRSEDDRQMTLQPRVLGGGKSSTSIIKNLMKDKVSKKALVSSHANTIYDEVVKQSFQCGVLLDAQLFLRDLKSVDVKNSNEIFRQAVQQLQGQDLQNAIDMFNPKNKKTNSTEEKVEFFLGLAMKARLLNIDNHIVKANKLKEAIMAQLLVFYGHFCSNDKGRYNNAPLLKLLNEQQTVLNAQAKDGGGADDGVEAVSKLMASTQI